MVPDRQKVWSEGRTEWTDDAKTISLRLQWGIIIRNVNKLELCHLCAACLIIRIYIPIKVHPNTLNCFGVMEYIQKFVGKKNKKNTYLKKGIFHQKIGNQLKRTWHHMKAEILKKLRENRVYQKVNLNVNQERTVRTSLN